MTYPIRELTDSEIVSALRKLQEEGDPFGYGYPEVYNMRDTVTYRLLSQDWTSPWVDADDDVVLQTMLKLFPEYAGE